MIPFPYKVRFYREDLNTRGCITEERRVDAWNVSDAVAQMELTGKREFGNDPYFRVLSIGPWIDSILVFGLEPVKISLPGQKGFKLTIHQAATVVTNTGQSVDVKAGDQVEWDGEKLVVVPGGQNG